MTRVDPRPLEPHQPQSVVHVYCEVDGRKYKLRMTGGLQSISIGKVKKNLVKHTNIPLEEQIISLRGIVLSDHMTCDILTPNENGDLQLSLARSAPSTPITIAELSVATACNTAMNSSNSNTTRALNVGPVVAPSSRPISTHTPTLNQQSQQSTSRNSTPSPSSQTTSVGSACSSSSESNMPPHSSSFHRSMPPPRHNPVPLVGPVSHSTNTQVSPSVPNTVEIYPSEPRANSTPATLNSLGSNVNTMPCTATGHYLQTIMVRSYIDGKEYRVPLGDMSTVSVGQIKGYLAAVTGTMVGAQLISYRGTTLYDYQLLRDLALTDTSFLGLSLSTQPTVTPTMEIHDMRRHTCPHSVLSPEAIPLDTNTVDVARYHSELAKEQEHLQREIERLEWMRQQMLVTEQQQQHVHHHHHHAPAYNRSDSLHSQHLQPDIHAKNNTGGHVLPRLSPRDDRQMRYQQQQQQHNMVHRHPHINANNVDPWAANIPQPPYSNTNYGNISPVSLPFTQLPNNTSSPSCDHVTELHHLRCIKEKEIQEQKDLEVHLAQLELEREIIRNKELERINKEKRNQLKQQQRLEEERRQIEFERDRLKKERMRLDTYLITQEKTLSEKEQELEMERLELIRRQTELLQSPSQKATAASIQNSSRMPSPTSRRSTPSDSEMYHRSVSREPIYPLLNEDVVKHSPVRDLKDFWGHDTNEDYSVFDIGGRRSPFTLQDLQDVGWSHR